MSSEALKSQLVQHGVDPLIATEFLKACTIKLASAGRSQEPERLMEALVVGRSTGSFSYSVKPYNVFIHIPKLVASALASTYGFTNSGDALALLLGAAGIIMGASVVLTRTDAAVVLALHDLDAYAGLGRHLEEAAVVSKCADYVAAWSLAPIDTQKFRESVNNLHKMKAVNLSDGRIALAERVIASWR